MTAADDVIDAGPILAVSAIEAIDDYHLCLHFSDGETTVVDLAGLVFRSGQFTPIRTPAAFACVRIVDGGAGVAWDDETDISAEALRAIAHEQRPMTGAEFTEWLARHQLSSTMAAEVLGLAPRLIRSYGQADTVPAAVAIACRVLAPDPLALAAHFKPRRTKPAVVK